MHLVAYVTQLDQVQQQFQALLLSLEQTQSMLYFCAEQVESNFDDELRQLHDILQRIKDKTKEIRDSEAFAKEKELYYY